MATVTMGATAATYRAPIPAPAFSSCAGLGHRAAAVPRQRAGGRRLQALAGRPSLFSPRAVSDSRSSLTCLDPDASTVWFAAYGDLQCTPKQSISFHTMVVFHAASLPSFASPARNKARKE